MTRQAHTTHERPARRSRGAQLAAAVRDVWSDCHYASRRLVELQTGPMGEVVRGRTR